jgi:ribosomal protein L37AE/L43A
MAKSSNNEARTAEALAVSQLVEITPRGVLSEWPVLERLADEILGRLTWLAWANDHAVFSPDRLAMLLARPGDNLWAATCHRAADRVEFHAPFAALVRLHGMTPTQAVQHVVEWWNGNAEDIRAALAVDAPVGKAVTFTLVPVYLGMVPHPAEDAGPDVEVKPTPKHPPERCPSCRLIARWQVNDRSWKCMECETRFPWSGVTPTADTFENRMNRPKTERGRVVLDPEPVEAGT